MTAMSDTPKPGELVRDYVFPIMDVTYDESTNGVRFEQLLGTGFLIGSQGMVLTARHVLEASQHNRCGAYANDSGWFAYSIEDIESHPSEDVAIGRMSAWPILPLHSPFRISSAFSHAWMDYFMCGYPADLLYEIALGGVSRPRPDMISLKGYIRRRVPFEVPGIRGRCFIEVSQVGGSGCSGAPIFLKPSGRDGWEVIGLYVAERHANLQTVELEDKVSLPLVGYAVRSDAIYDWCPEVLERIPPTRSAFGAW
jgi:hypothetical protein